jgi:hypothetical protein
VSTSESNPEDEARLVCFAVTLGVFFVDFPNNVGGFLYIDIVGFGNRSVLLASLVRLVIYRS